MSSNAAAAPVAAPILVNGVNVDQVMGVIGEIDADAAKAEMQFRIVNQWIDGGLNRSSAKDFDQGGQTNNERPEAFLLDADEPAFLAGGDTAANPMEFVLHGLASCMTTSLVYHAAVQGIEIASIESKLEGDMDTRGLFGMSDEVRKGFHHVRVKMRVQSDASAEQLRELALFSPVHDILSKSLPVELVVEKV